MNKYTFMGNGRNKDFHFTFSFFSKGDIVVKINGTVATGYGVFCIPGTGNNDFPFTGGHIHFATAPKSTDIITIERKLQLNRIIDYQPTVELNPTTINQDMNYFFELLKDIKSDLAGFQETYAEFTDTESAQTLLERIDAVMDEIDIVSEQIENLGDITTIQTSLSNLAESINTLSSTVGGHTTTIGSHTTSIGTLQSSVTTLSQKPTILPPDYTAGVTKAANTTHTATSDGWVLFFEFSNVSRYFTIDGVDFKFGDGNGGNIYSGNAILVPILKDHTFKGNDSITFFPCVSA